MTIFKENWLRFIEDLKSNLCKIDSYEFAVPLSVETVVEIENRFSIKLPPKFRNFLMNSAGGINVGWRLEGNIELKLKDEAESIKYGMFLFSLEEIYQGNCQLEEADDDLDEYDLEYHPKNLLAFASVPNGDQFAVVVSGTEIDAVKYLSHDLDEIHLYRVGEDINSFLYHYSRIGFAGPEYWIWEQFTNQHTTPIDSESPKAFEFIDAIRKRLKNS